MLQKKSTLEEVPSQTLHIRGRMLACNRLVNFARGQQRAIQCGLYFRGVEDALINLVQSFNLSVGIANSFLAKLKAAHAAGSGRAMCTNLDDFITEVQSQLGKKLGKQIS